MSIIEPTMGLTIPTINVDSGLVWEQAISNDLSIIANHNHSSGSGVQIPPNGLNINGDLTFNNNSAINLKALVLTPQASFSTVNSLYSIANDLYFNDGASNIIQITSGGVVNATSSGISSGAASASFVVGVLVVNAASNTPANIQGGSLLIGNNVPASKFLTLAPPAAMGANFTLTLPSLPGAQNFVSLDSSGNFGASWNVDNSSLQISSNVLQVKASGIVTSMINNGAVTSPKLANLNIQFSASSGPFITSSTSEVDVTNLSVTFTNFNRPIQISLNANSSTSLLGVGVTGTSRNTGLASFTIYRGVTAISTQEVQFAMPSASSVNAIFIPVSSISHTDFVSPGTYTYKVVASVNNPNLTAFVQNAILVVREL